MSFARAKINRFNDKKERASTAGIALKQTTSSQKSLIPKFRSLSQPPSTQCINAVELTLIPPSLKEGTEEVEIRRPRSVKSEDDFKDCLMQPEGSIDGKGKCSANQSKSELGSESTMMTADDHKLTKCKSEKGSTSKLKAMSRKNSSSGIPISVSGSCQKTTKLTTPRVSPRTPQTTTPKKPSMISQSSSNEKDSTKKNWELFAIKKKRYDLLKKEILDKQKPILLLYQALQQLKKKLEDGGKPVTLDSIKLIECQDIGEKSGKGKPDGSPDLSAGGETVLRKVDLNPKIVSTMRGMVQEIPKSLINLCKSLIDKRNEMLMLLERNLDPTADHEILRTEILHLRMNSDEVDIELQKVTADNEEVVNLLVDKWSELVSANELITSDKVRELEGKVKKQEASIMEMNDQLERAKQEMKEVTPADTAVFEEENAKLREKISQLEKLVDAEKKKSVSENEKFKKADLALKTFKSKTRDFESSKDHLEQKINQLSQENRSSQLKMKQMEKNYEKELSELNKSRSLDKSVIERLNKDKSTFESRLQTSSEIQERMKNDFEGKEIAMRKELQATRNESEINRNYVAQLKKEIELLRKQLSNLEVQTQQAAEVMTRRKDHCDKIETDRECELQVEVVAQRAAIRALQEKIEANAAEKLRFIETIEKINGTREDMNDTIVKSLVKKEEDITKYNLILRRNDELINKQKMEIENLLAKQENLIQQIDSLQTEENSSELKCMLKEGKSKLEHALTKSLENEHKIIKYEHELAQKNQAIADLENMMKVRDGLIGVMKAKKDELTMENQSLTKYSEEIRCFVLESKVELKEKTDLIHVYQTQLSSKEGDMQKLERKVQELEQKLTMTNEKRYKLQETIGSMERELEDTKLQVNQIEDMQTRYDLGRISDGDSAYALRQWNHSGAELYEKYKKAYQEEQKLLKQIESETRTIHRNYYYRTSTVDVNPRASNEGCNFFVADRPANSIFGAGREFKPVLFNGVDRYRVMNKGSLLWCKPTSDMQSNNSLIIRDMIAQTCKKADHTVDLATKCLDEKLFD